jgi:hypothetical protein
MIINKEYNAHSVIKSTGKQDLSTFIIVLVYEKNYEVVGTKLY